MGKCGANRGRREKEKDKGNGKTKVRRQLGRVGG